MGVGVGVLVGIDVGGRVGVDVRVGAWETDGVGVLVTIGVISEYSAVQQFDTEGVLVHRKIAVLFQMAQIPIEPGAGSFTQRCPVVHGTESEQAVPQEAEAGVAVGAGASVGAGAHCPHRATSPASTRPSPLISVPAQSAAAGVKMHREIRWIPAFTSCAHIPQLL